MRYHNCSRRSARPKALRSSSPACARDLTRPCGCGASVKTVGIANSSATLAAASVPIDQDASQLALCSDAGRPAVLEGRARRFGQWHVADVVTGSPGVEVLTAASDGDYLGDAVSCDECVAQLHEQGRDAARGSRARLAELQIEHRATAHGEYRWSVGRGPRRLRPRPMPGESPQRSTPPLPRGRAPGRQCPATPGPGWSGGLSIVCPSPVRRYRPKHADVKTVYMVVLYPTRL
ncbi:hypothetical protein BH24CHL7_BH24CHL7_15550 [soil metagenome]